MEDLGGNFSGLGKQRVLHLHSRVHLFLLPFIGASVPDNLDSGLSQGHVWVLRVWCSMGYTADAQ